MNNQANDTRSIPIGGAVNVSSSARALVLTSLFTAIILIMAFVPNLGYINLIIIKATLIHIPVIIGSIFQGPKRGAFLGGIFGLTSFINNTLNPSVLSFAFSPIVSFSMFGPVGVLKSLFICFVPRIMIGVGAYYVCRAVLSRGKGKVIRSIAYAASGVAGAMIDTLLVMGSIFFLYSSAYAEARQIPEAGVFNSIIGIVFGQGLLEAIVSGIIVSAVGTAIAAASKSSAA